MAHRLRWSPRAASNLERICEHIAEDSETYALAFARRIVALVEALPDFPRSGRVVPEYGDDNIREKLHGSYRIVYRLQETAIEVVTIIHGARLLRDEL